MYLRRFADKRGRLVMINRDNPTQRRIVTVNNACNEVGYYSIPTEDVQPSHREGHDPELVERVLSDIEGDAAAHLDRILLNHVFPPSREARLRLSLFVALQMTRGWGFRTEMEALANIALRQSLQSELTPDRIEEFVRRQGKTTRPQDLEAFAQNVLGDNAPRLRLEQAHAVQESLRFALKVATPQIYSRRWGVRVFDSPILLTSDEPVALWNPGAAVDPQPGVVNAEVIWWPVDRHHVMMFAKAPGEESVKPSTLARARQVNLLVAAQAERWVFYHPDDEGLGTAELPPRSRFVEELVDVSVIGNEVRELFQVVKRQPRGNET